MRLKCVSINVRCLRTALKRAMILRELESLDYDVHLLQETRVSDKQQADAIARLWHGKCIWYFSTGKSDIFLFT